MMTTGMYETIASNIVPHAYIWYAAAAHLHLLQWPMGPFPLSWRPRGRAKPSAIIGTVHVALINMSVYADIVAAASASGNFHPDHSHPGI